MFIFMLLLIVLAVAGIAATIRSLYLDGYGQKTPHVTDEYDALIRWR
ncbi:MULTISPECIES: hypothetical protein [unclassified Cryobacterium]|nr:MULTISPECIES: hypothetical protein [unclassified Cryobacterium]